MSENWQSFALTSGLKRPKYAAHLSLDRKLASVMFGHRDLGARIVTS